MQAYVAIGANCEFKLSEAVLIYRAGGEGPLRASTGLSRLTMEFLISRPASP
jgi:hypothetical protein